MKAKFKIFNLPVVAIVLGGLTVFLACLVGLNSHQKTFDFIYANHQQLCLSKAKTFAHEIEGHLNNGEHDILMHVGLHWTRMQDKPSDEYICIVDENSNLVFHSLHSDTIGNYAGSNSILDDEIPTCKLSDIVRSRQNYVGGYISSSGQKQIAAFVFIPNLNWTIGVHRSKDAMVAKIQDEIQPIFSGLMIVCGFLIPLSILLLCLTFYFSQKKRIKAERELEQSEEFLNSTGRIAKIGGWEFDLKSEKFRWTEATKLIHEVSLDYEPSLKKAFDFHPPEDRHKIEQAVSQAIYQDKPFDLELRLITAKGNTVWCHSIGKPHIVKGKTIKLYGTFQDITKRKKADEVLRASEEKYKSLTENLCELVYTADPITLEAVYINKAVEQFYGYTPEEWLNDSTLWVNSIHPDDKNRVIEEINKRLKEKKEYQLEYRIIRKDGSIRFVVDNIRFRIDKHGILISINGIMYDITKRKQVEDALRLSEEKFSKAFYSSPDSFTISSIDTGQLLEVNEGFEQMFGYSRQEVIGKTVLELNLWESYDVRAIMRKGLEEKGRVRDLEVIGRAKSGERIVCLISCEIIEINSKSHLLAITKNITKLKKAEEDADQRKTEIAHSSRLASMGQMVTGLAHEINQPLCAITSFADAAARMLESKRFKIKDVSESMRGVSSQAHRAGEIVKNLRAFVRKEPTKSSVVDVCDVIRNSIILAQGQINQKQAVLEMDIPVNPLLARVNEIQIGQVIINLVQNALEAMEQTDIGERKIIINASSTEDNMILVSVTDFGKGLDDIDPSQMFKPFFTTKKEGMGIGLSINSSIIEDHKGELWAEDNGNGATFNFTIPNAIKQEIDSYDRANSLCS